MISRYVTFAVFILALCTTGSASGEKVESIGPCTHPGVPEAVRSELQSGGSRVVAENGPLCEVWLRKDTPQISGASGSSYDTFANGTFFGVIHYPSRAGDYRGQAIKPGTYIMRYQAIPQDGNHLGVSPTPDFFILTPVDADQDPKAIVEYSELMKLGKQASGTNHPHPLHLSHPMGGAPAFRTTDEGHGCLEIKTTARPAAGGTGFDLPVAIILIGKAEG
jgi:hypothetical protein